MGALSDSKTLRQPFGLAFFLLAQRLKDSSSSADNKSSGQNPGKTMNKQTRVVWMLVALWFAGVTVFIAYTVHDVHMQNVAQCIDGASSAAAADRAQGYADEADKISNHMGESCARQGNRSLHRQDWIGVAGLYLVPPSILGILVFVIAKAIRWGRKDGTAPVWKQTTMVLVGVFIGLAYWERHALPADSDDFQNCNEQSLNAVTAEQSRRNVTYDLTGVYAMVAVSDDKCMAMKSYEYRGGSGCSDSRSSYCYKRKWGSF